MRGIKSKINILDHKEPVPNKFEIPKDSEPKETPRELAIAGGTSVKLVVQVI